MNSETRTVDWILNIQGVEKNVNELVNAFDTLDKRINNISSSTLVVFASIESGAKSMVNSITEIMTPFEKINEVLKAISEWNADSVEKELNSVASALEKINEQMQKQQKQDLLTSMVNSAFTGYEIYDKKRKKGKYEEGTEYPLKKSRKYVSSTDNDTLGLFSDTDMATAGLLELAAAWDMTTIAQTASSAAMTVWNGICTAASAVTAAFGTVVSFLTSPIGLTVVAITALIAVIALLVMNWDTVKEVAANVWTGIQQVWSNVAAWFSENVVQPIVQFFRGMWDSIAEIWNGIVESVSGAIKNIADFFGNIFGGGVSVDVNANGTTANASAAYSVMPEVPHLARGAVLPANRPFLAIVGDQTHGTNIEAPLDTIKQAVAEVLAGQGGGETAELLRELIATVQGIEIGDDVIGKAAARYTRKTARARGT